MVAHPKRTATGISVNVDCECRFGVFFGIEQHTSILAPARGRISKDLSAGLHERHDDLDIFVSGVYAAMAIRHGLDGTVDNRWVDEP